MVPFAVLSACGSFNTVLGTMSRGEGDRLTPTSYAMLGLLSVRPWTTYELAKQMRRNVRWFWPRAERKLYDEPKRLAQLGLATAEEGATGRRTRTVYAITAAGRKRLRNWLAEPDFSAPTIELEALLHLFFAENGSPEAALTSLHRMREQSLAALHELSGMAEELAGRDEDAFHDRRAMNAVTMELLVRIHEVIRDWTLWAQEETKTWPAAERDGEPVLIGPGARGTGLFAAIAARRPEPS